MGVTFRPCSLYCTTVIHPFLLVGTRTSSFASSPARKWGNYVLDSSRFPFKCSALRLRNIQSEIGPSQIPGEGSGGGFSYWCRFGLHSSAEQREGICRANDAT